MAEPSGVAGLLNRIAPGPEGEDWNGVDFGKAEGVTFGAPEPGWVALDPRLTREEAPVGVLGLFGRYGKLSMLGPEAHLLRALGAIDVRVARPDPLAKIYKLAVYVPLSHLEALQSALFAAGAGALGAYTECSFYTVGRGTFRPGRGTSPYIGREGKRETVEEAKLETVLPGHLRRSVMDAARAAHPYEDMAYDLFELDLTQEGYGDGRLGRLEAASTVAEVAHRVAALTGASTAFRGVLPSDPVRTLAVFFDTMSGKGPDVDVTIVGREGERDVGPRLALSPWTVEQCILEGFEADVKAAADLCGVPLKGAFPSPWTIVPSKANA